MAELPAAFATWEPFVRWLFQRTAGFPRRLRASLTRRIEERALDVYEGLSLARYSRRPADALHRVNLDLDRLRLLLRLARDLGALSHAQADHAAEQVDDVGRQVGGWLRHARGRGA